MNQYNKRHAEIKHKNKNYADVTKAFESIWYYPDPNDKVDMYMAEYLNAAGRDLGIKR